MATYTSKPTVVAVPAAELAAKFGDFRALQSKLDEMPAEQRQQIGDVAFTEDSIVITTPQVGAITLRAVERTPEKIVMQAEGSPVPMTISVAITPLADNESEVVGKMEVEIPAMLRPLVGPTLQKVVDQFGGMFASLA